MSALDICQSLLERVAGLGLDGAEAVLVESRSTHIKVYNAGVEQLETAGSKGIGLRLFRDGRMGYAYSTDPDGEALDWLAAKADENCRLAEPDPNNGIPAAIRKPVADLDLVDAEFDRFGIEDKVDIALTMEREALAFDDRVTLVEESTYVDGSTRFSLANSQGFSGSYEQTDCYGSLYLMAGEEPAIETGYSFTLAKGPGSLKPAEAGREAAKRAIIMLGSRKMPSAKVPVVFDPFAGIQLLQTLARGVSADAVQKGRSPFIGKLGEVIASPVFRVNDDGAIPGGIASAPFDGEGTPTGRTNIIEDGRLVSYLYDTYTARNDGCASTGNAKRGSYATGPEVGPTNFWLEPGEITPEELLAGVGEGFYVMDIVGLHSGANPVTGQFSVGASGLWIKDGAPAFGVRGVTIAGQLEDILKRVTAVADDLRWIPVGGAFGAPTFAVEEMTVGGD